MVAPCGTSLSSEIARPPAIRLRWARGTGRKPSEVTSNEISAALRPSWITARVVVGFAHDGIVERGHAFRQIGAEAADMADRKRFGRGVHGQIGIDDAVDLARWSRSPAPPVRLSAMVNSACRHSSGSNGDHQSGAIGGQHRQREFDGVRQLHRDHGIGRQSGFDEMRRQRGDGPIGLREGQALRRLAGDARLVEGSTSASASGCRARIRRNNVSSVGEAVGLGHGVTSVADSLAGCASASATRFPADSPSTRWLQAVLSDSIARSIALGR